jgi:hypothetical protein
MYCVDDSTYSYANICSAPSNPNFTVGFGAGGGSGARQLYVEYGGSATSFGSNMSSYLNRWTHIAVVRQSGTVTAYQNGVSLGSVSKSASVGSTANLYLLRNSGDSGMDFRGYISNFRITKSAVYTSNFTPSTIPFTTTSQGATSCQLLTFQDNRFKDNSSNASTVTPSGSTAVQAFSPFAPTAAYDTAVVGGSGYFDGTGDYLSAGTNSAFAFGTGDFTIECWIYLTGSNVNYRSIVSTRSSAGSGSGWVLATDASGSIYIYSNAFLVQASSAIVPNTWYHVAVCRASGTTTLYLNGVSKSTSTTARDYTDSGLAISNDPYVSGEVWQGYITGMRLVKGTAVYTAAFTPPTAPPTAITNTSLLLNYTNSGIYDSTAKNVLETVGNAQVSTTQAKWGTTSMYFDGTGDSLKGKLNNAIGGGDYTIEGWLYTGASGARYIFDMRETSQYLGAFTVGTTLYVNIGTTLDISATTSYPQNTWVHFAMVRSGSATNNTSVFLGGSRITQVTDTTNYSIIPTLYVGNDNTGAYSWSGYIDDFRITKGYARYSGSTYTPPAAAFPLL